jgi:hypothetical protein
VNKLPQAPEFFCPGFRYVGSNSDNLEQGFLLGRFNTPHTPQLTKVREGQ